MSTPNREMPEIVKEVDAAHNACIRCLKTFLRYGATTTYSARAWRDYCDARDRFNAVLAQLRITLGTHE